MITLFLLQQVDIYWGIYFCFLPTIGFAFTFEVVKGRQSKKTVGLEYTATYMLDAVLLSDRLKTLDDMENVILEPLSLAWKDHPWWRAMSVLGGGNENLDMYDLSVLHLLIPTVVPT